jgi:hypothetical protein
MRVEKVAPIALLCLALASTAICSGSYAHIDDNELWREADTVVLGTVTSITSEQIGSTTHRYVEIGVERYLKNPSESTTLVVYYSTRTYGRETDDGVVIADESSNIDLGFVAGEKVLVFLKRLSPDCYIVYGGFQGKYTVVNGKAMNPAGRVFNIPMPISPTLIIGSGFGVVALIFAWHKRDRLFQTRN